MLNRFTFVWLLSLAACGGAPFTIEEAERVTAPDAAGDDASQIDAGGPQPHDAGNEADAGGAHVDAPSGGDDSGPMTCGAGTFTCGGACECAYSGASTAPACCDSSCPVQHKTGLAGQPYYPTSPIFYDCVSQGTIDSQLAQDACNAYVTGRGGPADCAVSADTWCTSYMGDCICWSYAGKYAGTVLDAQSLTCASGPGASFE